MLNMIFAIVMDHFHRIKALNDGGKTLMDDAITAFYRWRGVRNGTYVPLDQVMKAVRDESRQEKLVSILSAKKATEKWMKRILLCGHGSQGDEEDNEAQAEDSLRVESHVSQVDAESSGQGSDSGDENGSGPHKHHHEGRIVMPDSLAREVSQTCVRGKMTETQAVDVIAAAVELYYTQHKKDADREEMMQTAEAVNTRMKTCVSYARQAHKIRDTMPIEELRWFGQSLNEFIEQIRLEIKADKQQLDYLRTKKSDALEYMKWQPPVDTEADTLGA